MKTKNLVFLFLFIAVLTIVLNRCLSNSQGDYNIFYDYNEEDSTAVVDYIIGSGHVVIPSSVHRDGKTYTVNRMGHAVFHSDAPVTSLSIPNTIDIESGCSFDCDNLTAINVAKDNPKYCSIDGVVFSKDSTTLLVYPRGKQGAYIIPDFVTKLEEGAFCECKHLSSVVIHRGVNIINESAFLGCPQLSSITLLCDIDSVENIFDGCDSLIAINVANDNPKYCSIDGVVFSKDSTTLLAYPRGKQGAYIIPDFVTKLGKGAFFRCKGLTSVTIPNGVKDIGSFAFGYCSELSTIIIPSSVESLGTRFAGNCDHLIAIHVDKDNPKYCSIDGVLYSKDITTIIQYPGGKPDTFYTLPQKVINVGSGAFAHTKYLVTITLPKGLKRIEDDAFMRCDSLTTVNIPNGVTYIGNYAFHWSSNVTSANIPNSVQYIGDHAFTDCKLTSVNIPEGIKEIKTETFFGCSIKSVKIPNSVTIIGCQAFMECQDLTDVKLGKGVKRIEGHAFRFCPIESINIPNSVTTIGYKAFDEDVLQSIKIPSSVTSIGEDCDCEGYLTHRYLSLE